MSMAPGYMMVAFAAAYSSVGFAPPSLFVLVFWGVLVAYIAMVIQATLLVARKGEGVEVPVWIFAIVLLPFIGAIGAAAHYKNR